MVESVKDCFWSSVKQAYWQNEQSKENGMTEEQNKKERKKEGINVHV